MINHHATVEGKLSSLQVDAVAGAQRAVEPHKGWATCTSSMESAGSHKHLPAAICFQNMQAYDELVS